LSDIDFLLSSFDAGGWHSHGRLTIKDLESDA
jgi:hypothetical protein